MLRAVVQHVAALAERLEVRGPASRWDSRHGSASERQGVAFDHPLLARRFLRAPGFELLGEPLDREGADDVDLAGDGDGSARTSGISCDVAADPVASIVSPNDADSSLT
jgi:hypothetical protein